MMDILQKYYIFRETKLKNQAKDKLTIKQNIIFYTIVRYDHQRGLPDAFILREDNNQFQSHNIATPIHSDTKSNEQHTSGRSPPSPRSTKKSKLLYKTIVYSPEYRTAN